MVRSRKRELSKTVGRRNHTYTTKTFKRIKEYKGLLFMDTTMAQQILGEFIGTLVLILLGDGVVAAGVLKKTKSENSGWVLITFGWGLAVTIGVLYLVIFLQHTLIRQ